MVTQADIGPGCGVVVLAVDVLDDGEAGGAELIAKLTARVELERRLGADPFDSSRPPSTDSPFTKKPANARSSRRSSGRKPGKQNGDPGVSRSLSDHPDQVVNVDPAALHRTLGTRIHQVPPRDPAKGVVERANGFFTPTFWAPPPLAQ